MAFLKLNTKFEASSQKVCVRLNGTCLISVDSQKVLRSCAYYNEAKRGSKSCAISDGKL